MRLLNKVFFIIIAQGAAKLPEVKVGSKEKNLGLEPGPHSSGADQAEKQNFFQTSKLDIW